MADLLETAPPVDDGYLAYFTEKIWAMIPEVYRHEDGTAIQPGVLRALVETWARQAVTLRRDQDRLWEDFFIEMCSLWAVPYIGDLVGTRLLSPYNPRGQRIDVAKTIYYRRRAGTLRVLEEPDRRHHRLGRRCGRGLQDAGPHVP